MKKMTNSQEADARYEKPLDAVQPTSQDDEQKKPYSQESEKEVKPSASDVDEKKVDEKKVDVTEL